MAALRALDYLLSASRWIAAASAKPRNDALPINPVIARAFPSSSVTAMT
jgi:hypothetical protein